MRGLIESGLRQNSVLCVEMARRVLDIIKWAREEWKDIPDEERGREYTPEFERQVRIVLLNNAEKVCRPTVLPQRSLKKNLEPDEFDK